MSFSVPNSVDPKSRASIWLESQRLNLSVVCDGLLDSAKKCEHCSGDCRRFVVCWISLPLSS